MFSSPPDAAASGYGGLSSNDIRVEITAHAVGIEERLSFPKRTEREQSMMLMSLINGITVSKIFQMRYGQLVVNHDLEINGIRYDSRAVEQGDLFVAVKGWKSDGHSFIVDAIRRGASVIVLENDAAAPDSLFLHSGVVKIVVPSSRRVLADLAARWYGRPADRLTMIGVTGTNGKTTTMHLIRSVCETDGASCGMIGTIEYVIGAERIPAPNTTPEPLELMDVLARMADHGCTSAVMEVSSHALDQERVHGIRYRAAVFTNLTQDHLDYHGSMEQYFSAKKRLFDQLQEDAWAVVNVDDEWGREIVRTTPARAVTYGLRSEADVRATDIRLSMRSTRFSLLWRGRQLPVNSPLIGRFNVSNCLAAAACGIALGYPVEAVRGAIEHPSLARGRFEQLASPDGWIAVIDYAHTPDALEKTLRALHDILGESGRGRIVTVFGCGGDRDKTKRPLMGRIAAELSDRVIVTSDNPRSENPHAIIEDVVAGMQPQADVVRQADRERAIIQALQDAQEGDIVLIAGKGHEEYQIVGERKFSFNDKVVVEHYLRDHA